MTLFYGDLHVHIGRTNHGQAVKISASPQLTLENICRTARKQKGLNLIGIIDAACQGVLNDLHDLSASGAIKPISQGGFLWEDLVLFLGSEVELARSDTGRVAHFLAFFPCLKTLDSYAKALKPYVTNPNLSTQRIKTTPDTWLQMVMDHDGVALAAHAFTPHKGVYGNCVEKLGEMFRSPELIKGLELGLSANTEMALQIKDTHKYAFISNSDAHSLNTIGREFTLYDLEDLNFTAWVKGLELTSSGIVSNHGLEPLLGKYYRSFCKRCQRLAPSETLTLICPYCEGNIILGVWDRLQDIADTDVAQYPKRPDYFAHVPLFMLPGVGPKTYERLISQLGTEIEIMYTLPLEEIASKASPGLAEQIAQLRLGSLPIQPGGGGKYGRITKSHKR